MVQITILQYLQVVKVIIHFGLEMDTVMTRQTPKDAILMVETAADQALMTNIAKNAFAIKMFNNLNSSFNQARFK